LADGASPDSASPDSASPDGALADSASPDGALADGALAEVEDIDEEIPTDEPWCEVEPDSSDDSDDDSQSFAATPDASMSADAVPAAGLPDASTVPEPHEILTDSGRYSGQNPPRSESDLAEDAAESEPPHANDAAEDGVGHEASAAERAAAVGKAKARAAKRMAAAKAALAAEDEASQAMVPGQRESEEDGASALTPLPGLAAHEIAPALEAILMVVDEPVSEILLAQVLEIPAEDIAGTLIELSASYTRDGKGFDLRRAAGGWRFYTRADYSAYVERFVLDGQQLRLTQASLETLAVVAYKQPVTRSRISAIRGVNVDGVVRTLVTRGMVEECGADPDSGAHLYRTTSLFLEKLGLDSVEQLPPLAPFLPENLDEVEAM
jgi:segregation and condensation protein B